MRSLSILILGSAIMMLMEVGAKPATYLVETADADEPVYAKVDSFTKTNTIFLVEMF